MVEAYILVQTEVGKAADVARQIAKISGVTQAEDVTGPYDVIVRAQADNVDELGRLVAANIQSVPGITRTLTCPVVHILAFSAPGRGSRRHAGPPGCLRPGGRCRCRRRPVQSRRQPRAWLVTRRRIQAGTCHLG